MDDKNGIMHAVSVKDHEHGIMISFFYGGGRVSHIIPHKVFTYLVQEIRHVESQEQKGESKKCQS